MQKVDSSEQSFRFSVSFIVKMWLISRLLGQIFRGIINDISLET